VTHSYILGPLYISEMRKVRLQIWCMVWSWGLQTKKCEIRL